MGPNQKESFSYHNDPGIGIPSRHFSKASLEVCISRADSGLRRSRTMASIGPGFRRFLSDSHWRRVRKPLAANPARIWPRFKRNAPAATKSPAKPPGFKFFRTENATQQLR
jgi:hypothetical protein